MAETIIDSEVESTEVTLTLKSSHMEDTALNVKEEEKGPTTDPLDDVEVAPTTSTLGPEKTQPEPKTQDEQSELSDTQESSDESAFEAIEAEAEDVEVLAHDVSTNSIAAFAAQQHIDLSASSTTRDAEYSHFSASSMEETFFEDDEDYADDDESCAFSLIDNHSIFIMQASSDEPSTIATKASSNASASRHTQDEQIPSLSGKEPTTDKLANNDLERPLVVSTHLHSGNPTTMMMDDTKHTKHNNVAFFYMEESVEMIPLWDQHFLNESHEQTNGKQDDEVQQPPMGGSKKQTPNKIQLTISTVSVESLTKTLTDHKNTNTAPHENLSRLSIATTPSQTSSLTKTSRGSSIHKIEPRKLPSKLAISKPQNDGVHLISLDPKQLKPRTQRKKPAKMIEESITIVKPVKHRRRGTRPSYQTCVNRQIQRQVEEWNNAMAVAQAEEATPKHSNDHKTRQKSKKTASFASSDSLPSDQNSSKATELEEEMRAMLISSQKMSNTRDRRVALDAFLRLVEEQVAEHKAKTVNDPDLDLVRNKDGASSKSTYLEEEEGFLLSFSGFCNKADEDLEESIETMPRKRPALEKDPKPQVNEAEEKDSCELDDKALEKQMNSRATSEGPVTHGEIVKGSENPPEALEAVLVRKPVFFPRAARRQRALSRQYGAEKRIQNAMSPKSTRRWWKRFSKQIVQDNRDDHEMTNTLENGQVEQREVEQPEVEEKTIQRKSEDDQHEVASTDTLCCAFDWFRWDGSATILEKSSPR